MNKIAIQAKSNVWGKYSVYIEQDRVGTIWLSKHDATLWIIQQLDTGLYVLSTSSYIAQEDVDAYAARFR